MFYLRFGLTVVLAAVTALGQSAGKLEFGVAAIRPSAPPDPQHGMTVGCYGGPGTHDPTLLVCQNWDLANLVGIADEVSDYQLSAPD